MAGMTSSRRPVLARLLPVGALGVGILAIQVRLRGETDIVTQVWGQLAAFALFACAATLVWRGDRGSRATVVVILLFAVAFRAAAFNPASVTPPLSTDIHRYAWDGRVQAAGINPYRLPPSDDALRPLREGDSVVWPRINHRTWATVYPPAAQASFVTARVAFGAGLRATTWLYLLAEAAAIGLLLLVLTRMGAPPGRIIVYAWHPLAVSEIAANGHADALAVLAVAAFLAAWQVRRHVVAGLMVALAVLVKLGPAVLIPVFARRGGRRFTVAAVAGVALGYVPYLLVGTAVIGSLGQFAREQRFNGSLQPLLARAVGDTVAAALLVLALVAVIAVMSTRDHATVGDAARSVLVVLGAFLLVISYVQPWYALWLIPCMVLVASPGWMWLTGALPIAYVNGLDGTLPPWVQPLIYGPLGVWALWRVVRLRRRERQRPPAPAPGARVAVVIPVLNEAEALEGLLPALWATGAADEIVVVDGGSTDATRLVASAAGARIVFEPTRGYGRACAAGARAARADVIVFMDGDGSDDPSSVPVVLREILEGRAALSLGARRPVEAHALTGPQRMGNWLVAWLIRLVYGAPVHDIPSLRAIRRETLLGLSMREMTYGWPTEMIVKAARHGHAIVEVQTPYRARRGGESKVSGRVQASVRAAALMLAVALRHA